MDKIRYLKHCTSYKTSFDILNDGFIYSAKELKIEPSYPEEDVSKVFVQVVYKGEETEDYLDDNYGMCFLLDPKLINDMDFTYNPHWVGTKQEISYSKKKYLELLKQINSKNVHKLSDKGRNEIMLNEKISLDKYMIGVRVNILFDEANEWRMDLAGSCKFSTYYRFFTKGEKPNKNRELKIKRIYVFFNDLMRKLKKYTSKIKFNYLPLTHSYCITGKKGIDCNKYDI